MALKKTTKKLLSAAKFEKSYMKKDARKRSMKTLSYKPGLASSLYKNDRKAQANKLRSMSKKARRHYYVGNA